MFHEQVKTWRLADWDEAVVRSSLIPMVDGVRFPAFPPENVQIAFVGQSGEPAMRAALTFVQAFRNRAAALSNPIDPNARMLDFGCGWGRILRFFAHQVPDDRLFGVDVDPEMIRICQETGIPGRFCQVSRDGPLPFPDGFFSHIFSYSVFTHLPRDAADYWLAELKRVCTSDAIFCLTVEPPRFVDFVADPAPPFANDWHALLHGSFGDIARSAQRDLEHTGYAFFPTCGEKLAPYYGDSVYTEGFIRQNWSKYFKLLEYLDDPQQFWQAFLTMTSASG